MGQLSPFHENLLSTEIVILFIHMVWQWLNVIQELYISGSKEGRKNVCAHIYIYIYIYI